MKKFILLFVFGMFSLYSSGQLDNSYFSWRYSNAKSGSLNLHIENLNYFRNVEYRSPIDEGRTLFGLQLCPELTYQIGEAWKLSTGIFLKRDFGSDEFDQNFPTYQLKYSHNNTSFLFGRLEGNMDHGLIEPLLDPEKIITDRTENGFQYLMSRKRFDLDIWLDWKKAIYPLSSFREEFDAGVTGQYNIITRDSFLWSIPVDVLAHHKGGEIDTSGLPSVSQFTFSYGTVFSWQIAGSGLRRLRGGLYFNNYEDVSTRATTFIDGLGQYAFISADWSEFGVMVTYWDGHQFQSSNGDVYYQSVSRKDPRRYLLDYRKVWMFRGFFERDLGNDLSLLARVNYIYDANENQNDLITEFYLRWIGALDLKSWRK